MPKAKPKDLAARMRGMDWSKAQIKAVGKPIDKYAKLRKKTGARVIVVLSK